MIIEMDTRMKHTNEFADTLTKEQRDRARDPNPQGELETPKFLNNSAYAQLQVNPKPST